jgi:hypothetical protein
MGEKYNDTAHAVENMPRSPHYTTLHTNIYIYFFKKNYYFFYLNDFCYQKLSASWDTNV